VPVEQLVDGFDLADDGVVLDIHAHLLDDIDLRVDDRFGQAELRNAVHQHAARQVQRLVDRHRVARAPQVDGDGQAGGTAAHHADALARVGANRRHVRQAVLALPVRREPLQPANRHRLPLLGEHACLLALLLLGAHAATDGGQHVRLFDHVNRTLEVALGDAPHEARDVHPHRAPDHAGRFLALYAAVGLDDRGHGEIAEGHLGEIGAPHVRLLLRHGLALDLHPLFGFQVVQPLDFVAIQFLIHRHTYRDWLAWAMCSCDRQRCTYRS